MDAEILIVGAGIFGVSTAYHLAQRHRDPSKITVLDRAPAPAACAASTDINKIVRADYSKPFYVELAYEAMDAWRSFPFFRDANVYHQTGWVMMDEKNSDLATRIRKNFRDGNREDVSADLTEEEVRTRWGGLLAQMDAREYGSYYWNPSAGWADAAKAVEVMMHEATRLGVKYEVGEAARIIFEHGAVKGVETKDGRRHTAEKVLLATGAWTSQLMSTVEDELNMPDAERVENQVTAAGVCVAHFQLKPEEAALYRQLPVLIFGAKGEVLPPTDRDVFKFTNATSFRNTITTKTGHKISVPPDQEQHIVPLKLQEESIKLVRDRIPQILENGRKVDYYRMCWDGITPNQSQLLTQHPDPRLSNLYFAVGGSFHSWKFLPTIGKYVANVLEGISNGPEKDEVWSWKHPSSLAERGAHEKVVPRRELRDLE
ncbi:hypothetical protein DTO021D3_9075 [Paecilomyces variotii]|nr:hypothetical protein DTO032I3_8192 [Paecilomyces variotii]KAJ9274081.1 hypothetical protein DTO021D3_9075 [Paecilomyces variotii]KAJ9338538.1 hypothetical protein DTO027B6_8885 [Paecilomyces variotii]KAJ9378390.1 hypothetical protein DTO032I4_7640 [Paecilomyces variotii]